MVIAPINANTQKLIGRLKEMQMSDLMSNGKEYILWGSGENKTDLRRQALQPIARTKIKETGAE